MNIFPVINSTISAEYLGVFIQEKYGLSSVTSCQLFRAGINDTYFIADQERSFVFRIYSFAWRSFLEISEEIRLLNLLKEHTISISYLIKDKDQSYIQRIPAPEGERFGVLFSFAAGQKVRFIAEKTAFQIGVLMAKMHEITVNKQVQRIDYDAHTLTQLPYQYARQHFSESNEDMRFVKRAGAIISEQFKQASGKNLRQGIVHLDMWYDNMSIQAETDITIFDFDFCGNGWLLHDIAYFSKQLFHIESDKNVYASKLNAFFNGYESIISISEIEKKLISYAGLSIWIFYLGVQSQRFDNWSNVFLSENYLNRYIGMTKSWLAYHQINIAVFDE